MGTVTPLRHRRPGPVRASAHLSPVLVGAGVTSVVHSHGPAPFAPVAAADCKGAHDRVSDRAVDRPCSRLIRPQGPHPRTAAWRASLRRSHAAGCCWFSDTQAARPVGPGALVVRSRPPWPGSTSRTRGSPRGRPTPLPTARLCAAVLSTCVLARWHLGCGCRPHSPYMKSPANVADL